jgi:transcriptional regulator GlxA family with amidase domain
MLFDVVVFDGVDELDVIGPLEVFRRAEAVGADARSRTCTHDGSGPVSCAFGLRLHPDAVFVPGEADVVVVPGGGWVAHAEVGAWAEVARGQWPRLLFEASRKGSVMAAVCTGAMLLAHAGVLNGRRATTHHDARDDLAATGAVVVADRVVDDGDLVTSGGVTSGIDLALWLVCRYFGRELADLVAEGLEYTWSLPVATTATQG